MKTFKLTMTPGNISDWSEVELPIGTYPAGSELPATLCVWLDSASGTITTGTFTFYVHQGIPEYVLNDGQNHSEQTITEFTVPSFPIESYSPSLVFAKDVDVSLHVGAYGNPLTLFIEGTPPSGVSWSISFELTIL